jgi:hypothetical protein
VAVEVSVAEEGKPVVSAIQEVMEWTAVPAEVLDREASTTKGPDGIITFASGIDVDTLLPKVAIIIPKGGGGVKHPQDKGEIHP